MKPRSVAPMKIAKFGYLIMSLLLIAAGVVCIAVPGVSAKVIGIIVGISLIIFGIIRLIGFFCRDPYRLAFRYDLECGILMLILGIVILISPESLMNYLSIALGVSALIDGLFKIRVARDSKEFGVDSWWLILIMAIITVVAGTALIFDCAAGAALLTVFLGISLLSEGILNICTVIATVIIVKNQQPDVIETTFTDGGTSDESEE